MPDHSAVYIGTAFIAGVSLALIVKGALNTQCHEDPAPSSSKSQPQGLVARPGPPAIVEGIEGCIGNTPLFRIKSLSDETGCEILGKAEVCRVIPPDSFREQALISHITVPKWCRPEFKRPRSLEYD